uniref:Uncharacterized protein n=1 Tax=Glossina pallidipes TaxID=7398 RepID=A0A1B0A787_GLOPL
MGAEVFACHEKIKAKVIGELRLSDIKLIMLQLLPVPSFQVDSYMSKSTVVLHRQYRHYHHHNHRYHIRRTHPYLHAILPEVISAIMLLVLVYFSFITLLVGLPCLNTPISFVKFGCSNGKAPNRIEDNHQQSFNPDNNKKKEIHTEACPKYFTANGLNN